jgi:hypothetical protein
VYASIIVNIRVTVWGVAFPSKYAWHSGIFRGVRILKSPQVKVFIHSATY